MSPDDIINAVYQVTGVTLDEVRTNSRKREIVYARKLITHYTEKIIPDPQIIAKDMNKSTDAIYSYRNNFDKELLYNKTLKFFKNECDKILNL
jgi:hypothetical protein